MSNPAKFFILTVLNHGNCAFIICDDSLVDIYYSTKGKYSYHWDRRLVTPEIYRHDNAPHRRWKDIPTFPKHFHNGSEDIVISSHVSDNPELALKEFLDFVSKHIKKDLSEPHK